jgi:hypothetical protein
MGYYPLSRLRRDLPKKGENSGKIYFIFPPIGGKTKGVFY